MQHLNYSLDQVTIEIPMTYFQYTQSSSLFNLSLIFILILCICQWLFKDHKTFLWLRKRILIAFGCGISSYQLIYSFNYIKEKQKLEIHHVRSQILTEKVIYSVRKDRPYTIYESTINKSNDKQIFDEIRGQDAIPNHDYRRNFNLAKNALLAIEQKAHYSNIQTLNAFDLCQKDIKNELYRCTMVIEKQDQTRIYAQSIIYTEPKAYQDYLRFGFHEKSSL